jgi:hypothetical protein
LSNSFANSHIYITDFSKQGPAMTFKVQVGDDVVKPLSGFPVFVGTVEKENAPVVGRVDVPSGNNIIINAGGRVYGFRTTGAGITNIFAGLVSPRGGQFQPALFDLNNDNRAEIIGAEGSRVYVWSVNANTGFIDTLWKTDVGRAITTPPVVVNSQIVIGDIEGVSVIDRSGSIVSRQTLPNVVSIISVGNSWTAFSKGKVKDAQGREISQGNLIAATAGDLVDDGAVEIATVESIGVTDQREVTITNQRSIASRFTLDVQPVFAPVIGDINKDGKREIVLTGGNKIFAYNHVGVLIDHFPITLAPGDSVEAVPVLGDVDGDGNIDIVVGTTSGQIVAYTATTGKMVRGFPLMTGGKVKSSPALFENNGKMNLAVASSDGYLYAWELPGQYNAQNILWSSYLHDARHTSYASEAVTATSPIADFFPTSRAYNWPNPVYEGKTKIRYFVGSNASVNIKIFDIAGEKITEFPGPGIGGIDNEVEWDVKNAESGVYLARIEAKGEGNTGVAIIKIAVVK